jgi:hypothetical protein
MQNSTLGIRNEIGFEATYPCPSRASTYASPISLPVDLTILESAGYGAAPVPPLGARFHEKANRVNASSSVSPL